MQSLYVYIFTYAWQYSPSPPLHLIYYTFDHWQIGQ